MAVLGILGVAGNGFGGICDAGVAGNGFGGICDAGVGLTTNDSVFAFQMPILSHSTHKKKYPNLNSPTIRIEYSLHTI
ncbi:hypothetical protein [Helcococcus kunzii]|uniref:hypothetical protein n=1 Tax=Helcococcus kunzii TaxID=40091 RepID=UPI0024ADE683|nr:hypothetical protein [Helcococcus kunzii]